ncbi:hypothetical protein A5678_25045 [Mycobacterium sp. E2733]|nr:hypothetical protein A5678_25045 [Mycobacterium sp. E2733]
MSAGAGSSAKRKAPEPDSASAAAAALARGQARARRRRRAAQRDYGDEFADMNVDVDPDWVTPGDESASAASGRGAGRLGFVGTAHREAAPAGLATLAEGEFSCGPTVPMMPRTWDAEGSSDTR